MKTTTPISAERFERLAPTLGPCELVRGEIIPMSPGGFEHSRVGGRIVTVLGAYAQKTKLGRVLTGEAGILVERDPDTVRGADAAYISFKRVPKGRRWTGFLRQPPELVIEVLGEKDTWEEIEKKVAEYHSIRVDMVWVVDPQTQSVRLYPRAGKPSVLHGSDELTGGRLLPGFRCRVSDFFED
jgi:Uma2 family endonuclease